MPTFKLKPHPDFPSSAITSIEVAARRSLASELHLSYRVEGAGENVLWPDAQGPAGPADNLWQHSCFEAFVARPDEAAYTELNFATSGDWAVYRFDGYRAGRHRDDDVFTSRSWAMPVSTFDARVHLPDLGDATEWRLNICAVIEAADGSKSYWALAHAPGPPDFHNPDCFVARLPAPTGA